MMSLGTQRPGIGLRDDCSSGDLPYAASAMRLADGGTRVDDIAVVAALLLINRPENKDAPHRQMRGIFVSALTLCGFP